MSETKVKPPRQVKGGKRDANKEKTKERILKAALDLFR